MREFFDAKQAAKMILADMIIFNIAFNQAWDNYNNEWYNNELLESDKEKVKQVLLTLIDRVKL